MYPPRRNQARQAWKWVSIVGTTVLVLFATLSLRFVANNQGGTQLNGGFREAQDDLKALESHCSNTCFKARDGNCDEGRTPEGDSLLSPPLSPLDCDLGTDCDDCGPWQGHVPPAWDQYEGPVAWARAQNVTMQVRLTLTPLPFLMAITTDKVDPDVSAMLQNYGSMEGGITRIYHWILNGKCEAGRRRRVVVDVGANMGYFAIMAAMYGCRVVAFEPVRLFLAYLEWSSYANGVSDLVHVVQQAVSDTPGVAHMALAKDGTYWGLASVNSLNLHPHEVAQRIHVPATTLDRWKEWMPPRAAPADIILLKLDIEGWEHKALKGGAKLLAKAVDHVITEYSPGIFERNKDLDALAELPGMVLQLAAAGFRLAHLPFFGFTAPWPPLPINGQDPLPALEEVLPQMAKYDIRAAQYRKAMEASPDACKLPSELAPYGVWNCREPAYATHPKGFRSAFGYNTNVWASRGKEPGLQKLAGLAALFHPDQDMKVWWSQSRRGVGLGLLDCNSVGHGHLVIFRCNCTSAAAREGSCKQQKSAVAKLAAQGKMPFTDED